MDERRAAGTSNELTERRRPTAWADETQRQRDDLMLLRDHLEQLLLLLLGAMPRADVESLLASCGSGTLMDFGREAVAATVVTALLQRPGEWKGAKEAIRRGCQSGHARSCDAATQEEAAALTEQLLSRLDFGLCTYQRRRAALDSALDPGRTHVAKETG